ncbi:DUF6221 family protein [Streptomyces luteogriseus]|uniref:DUF6221 family protein n=1 Tax=Streptomyces luteogriseus TaxID=68233 RepID=UPI00371F9D40
MEDLVGWLRAQLDTDERIARAATLGPWVQSGIGDYGWTVDFGRPGAGVETADTEQGLADADFIAAHNPTRVLREIDAKRQALRMAEQATEQAESRDYLVNGPAKMMLVCLKPVLRHLATVYADRSGYRKEWRP